MAQLMPTRSATAARRRPEGIAQLRVAGPARVAALVNAACAQADREQGWRRAADAAAGLGG